MRMTRPQASWVGVHVVFLVTLLVAGCHGETEEPHPIIADDAGMRDASALDASTTGPISGLVSLAIAPDHAILTLDGTTVPQQIFTAMGTFSDNHIEDVTSRVEWQLDPSALLLGQLTSNTFAATANRGGLGHVLAHSGSVNASATFTVTVARSFIVTPTASGTAAVPANAAALFANAATSGTSAMPPSIVYPNDGVILPPNLGAMELHWLTGGAANTLFRIRFKNAALDVSVYARCETPADIGGGPMTTRADGCIWNMTSDVWHVVSQTGRGGDAITLTISGTDDAGTSAYTSAAQTFRFSRDDLNGTIYYWTTTGTQVLRYDFGGDGGTPEIVLSPAQTESGFCVGCHAISHDGSKIFASTGGQYNGGMMLEDLTTNTLLRNSTARADHVVQFGTFAPDGNTLIGVDGDSSATSGENLMIFDTQCAAGDSHCGQQIGTISMPGTEASHPDWSPDGTRVAFSHVGIHQTSQRPFDCSIDYIEQMGSGWSLPRVLVPEQSGLNRYNPQYSPDNAFVVYNESTCPMGNSTSGDCDADSDPTSTIWAVNSTGGTPVRLANAMKLGALDMPGAALQATFPRFSPFVFTLSNNGDADTHIMWLTFASRRRYGLRDPSTVPADANATWLWMVAISPETLATGGDPSFPAFCLPLQALDTSNHIATWTTQAVGTEPELN